MQTAKTGVHLSHHRLIPYNSYYQYFNILLLFQIKLCLVPAGQMALPMPSTLGSERRKGLRSPQRIGLATHTATCQIYEHTHSQCPSIHFLMGIRLRLVCSVRCGAGEHCCHNSVTINTKLEFVGFDFSKFCIILTFYSFSFFFSCSKSRSSQL